MKFIFCLVTSVLFCLFPFASFAKKIEIYDSIGRVVKLDVPARRIVALAPHIVENLFSAGAGQYIVGAIEYCDYPGEAKLIPRVGSANGFSLEGIVELNPDLVVLWNTSRGAKLLKKLESIGITVYASDPHRLSEIPNLIRDYGKLAGTESIAEKKANAFEGKLAALKNEYRHKRKVSTFYQVWSDPLQTISGKHILNDVIEVCAGHNIFRDSPVVAPKVSMEALIELNPEVIVTSNVEEGDKAWLNVWERWSAVQAVAKQNMFVIDADLLQRHTFRILSGAQRYCEALDKARK